MFSTATVFKAQVFARVGKRGAPVRGRAPLAVSSKLVLVPCGDGDAGHLGGDVPTVPKIELANGLFEVGRSEPADIIIPVPSVSGRHAMLRVDDERVTVTDLRSTNGTYLDGNEITSMQAYEVLPGNTIIFGDEHLAMFELASELDDEPAAETQAPEAPAEPAAAPTPAETPKAQSSTTEATQ